jgi:hypothetical protein
MPGPMCVGCSNTFQIHSIHGVAALAVGEGEGCWGGVDRAAEWTAARCVSCRVGINGQCHLAPYHTDTALSVRCVASGHIGASSIFLLGMRVYIMIVMIMGLE